MPNGPKKRLVVLRDSRHGISFPGFLANDADEFITLEDLRSWAVTGIFLRKIFHYSESHLLAYRLQLIPRPFLVTFLVRAMTRGACAIIDELGHARPVTWGSVIRMFFRMAALGLRIPGLVRGIEKEVGRLEAGPIQKSGAVFDPRLPPVYLRTDMAFGVLAGGSVGHIAGVLNQLDLFTGSPLFLSTDGIPTVRGDIETHVLQPPEAFMDFREIPSLAFNDSFYARASSLLAGRPISFIYQRYSLNNYSGVRLAREKSLPFVLEFNGPEVWVSRRWGKPLRYEPLSAKIEMLNLMSADVVVVVSRPLREGLEDRGIPGEKILINPNGVEPEKYSPQIDGSAVRAKYGLAGKTVLGFIGTFGRWHGAELLAQAFGELIRKFPNYRGNIRLVMIGEGVTLPQAKETAQNYGVADLCTFTGAVPQAQGPAHLAACDILVSPTVPNPDGTPFFGSPTKLFEYMAMGKGIVASDLDQIGEILEHDKTAWLVKPGDLDSLVAGLKTLIDDEPRRRRLGAAARKEVTAKYTWKEHTRRIIEKLKERCS